MARPSVNTPERPPTALARPDLTSRADIVHLLTAFYAEALADPLLGPVFAIAGLDLHRHLPQIGDFWERSLLGSGGYAGKPLAVHRHLHRLVPLTSAMFDRWLELWSEAVDASFAGPVATLATVLAGEVAKTLQAQLAGHPGLTIVGFPSPAQHADGGPR